MNKNRVVVWFRNDLRVHDNASLFSAVTKYEEVIPVYCFDERQFTTTRLDLPKTGPHRARFLWESINNLKEKLRGLGSNLLVLIGKPEELVVDIAIKYEASAIFFSEEVTEEEKKVEEALEHHAWSKGIKTEAFWQSTLFHLQDLPFPVNQTPEVFTQFRKECEKFSRIQKVFATPKQINSPSFQEEESVEIDLKMLGLKEPEISPNGVLRFEGGESAALGRLQTYFWEQDLLKVYKETRNGLLGADYSSKFSPWLTLGCISPKYIYWEVLRYEKERKKNQSTYWLIFELIWRDYFRFICKKHGNKVFQLKGLKNVAEKWNRNESMFWKWAEGQTGIPFVDANMRELNQTGFMSNRGRQNVASFLVNDLGIDWRWGASYFESVLIDYDVCSNWGNWMYVAGVGNDPRENRYFNILKQAQNYDKKGDYIRHWIPELADIKGFDIHQPHTLSPSVLRSCNVSLGGNYPHPIVKMKAFSY
ncbi:DASH family cryptochrome [Mongoliitalea daihaiensis]|uniref:DASH family cryptochrome n=1 Tax=Mongoliitalea daihaiensis TaxID=2782006 RepID=UPI001F40B1C6|nr:DASH family cryptochrome [Mongoliitalea daihaiensis]UJP67001.1 DASH family cryptochrome [Mongoliitalea daihaiensis]